MYDSCGHCEGDLGRPRVLYGGNAFHPSCWELLLQRIAEKRR